MQKHRALIVASLLLCLCLVLGLLALTGIDQTNTLDDEALLPILFTLAALSGVASVVSVPSFLTLSRRWPPPLRPPQPFTTK
jgi:hypothetical protein